MKALLLTTLSVVAVAAGIYFLKEGRSVAHEIEALICFLGAGVTASGASIVDELHEGRNR